MRVLPSRCQKTPVLYTSTPTPPPTITCYMQITADKIAEYGWPVCLATAPVHSFWPSYIWTTKRISSRTYFEDNALLKGTVHRYFRNKDINFYVAGKQDIERMWRNLAKMSDTAWRRNSFKCRVGLQFSVYFICISVRIKWIQSRRYDFVTAHCTCQTCEFSGSVQVFVKLNWVDCVLILIQCERTFVYVMYMVQAAYVYKLIDTRWVMWWITCKPSLLHRSFSSYRIQAASI